MNNNENEYDYYLNTMDILEKYYGKNKDDNNEKTKTDNKKNQK